MINLLAYLVGVLVILSIIVLVPWWITAVVLIVVGFALLAGGIYRTVAGIDPPEDEDAEVIDLDRRRR
jgi:hypothetical protein